jgi:hypothetical protein
MLHRGDLVPHFEVRALDGEPVSYSSVWQLRNLVLATLPPEESDHADRYASELSERAGAFGEHDTTLIVTHDPVVGLAAPGVLIADRWGEVVHVASGPDLPSVSDLIAWVEYVQRRCPECEGESK